jgi:hypothetical protein
MLLKTTILLIEGDYIGGRQSLSLPKDPGAANHPPLKRKNNL